MEPRREEEKREERGARIKILGIEPMDFDVGS